MAKVKDTLGDRMKEYEMAEAGRKAMIGIPLIARLDGHGFHKYTKGLRRPYDQRLSQLMIDTTAMLVRETNALVGYCQSDEISLLYYAEYNSRTFSDSYIYGGRYQKLVSLLASKATTFFSRESLTRIPENKRRYPEFDCRVWQVPTKDEAANTFMWRELDATKNAISMAAHAYFPHKDLQNVTGSEKQELLFAEQGINFNDYPAFFKRGTYVKRKNVVSQMPDATWEKIPEQNRPESRDVVRSVVSEMDWIPAKNMSNYTDVLFYKDVEPIRRTEVV